MVGLGVGGTWAVVGPGQIVESGLSEVTGFYPAAG